MMQVENLSSWHFYEGEKKAENEKNSWYFFPQPPIPGSSQHRLPVSCPTELSRMFVIFFILLSNEEPAIGYSKCG
jgi:hypothetical protein